MPQTRNRIRIVKEEMTTFPYRAWRVFWGDIQHGGRHYRKWEAEDHASRLAQEEREVTIRLDVDDLDELLGTLEVIERAQADLLLLDEADRRLMEPALTAAYEALAQLTVRADGLAIAARVADSVTVGCRHGA